MGLSHRVTWNVGVRSGTVPVRCSVQERVVARFNTTPGNPIKEILLKLNLPDHMSILTDSKVTLTKYGKCTTLFAVKRYFLKAFPKTSNSLPSMHTRASNSELVEPLSEPERTLNRRLHRRNRRVPFEQRDERPARPRIVYLPILDISYFRRFLDILENYNPMDDEPMWAADRVVASTLGSAITIPETVNEFAIKGNHLTHVKGNQFDGRIKTDPHKHIFEFLEICDTFEYRTINKEVVRLMKFHYHSRVNQIPGWMNSKKKPLKHGMNSKPPLYSQFFPLLYSIDSLEKSKPFPNMKMKP
nr:reverse transcriptase domain-containing protein [Tanacetum cinerariifolium]